MRNALILTCTSILLFLFSSPVIAGNVKMKDNPMCEPWQSRIGEWTAEGESRTGPNGEWIKEAFSSKVEWILDGSFLQIKGLGDDRFQSIRTLGYDAHLKTHVGSFYNSFGMRGILDSGGWSGTSWTANWTAISPDGGVTPGRCNAEYNSDFTSGTGKCQQFTDGKWWTVTKWKETRVK